MIAIALRFCSEVGRKKDHPEEDGLSWKEKTRLVGETGYSIYAFSSWAFIISLRDVPNSHAY